MREADFLKNIRQTLGDLASEDEVKLQRGNVDSLLAVANKYRTLHEIGKLVASEMELDALLRLAMDQVVEVTRARRGFIALVDQQKEIDFKVARNMEKGDIEKPQFQVSRSIIDRVIAREETICLPDASTDPRFGDVESVVRLQLLSVLCAPIKIHGRLVGLIYVDNTNVKDLFDDAQAELVTAFSEQIAIALRNAYKFSDLKKSHQKIAHELRSKYRFDAIIGSGPKMTEILQLVADVADTDATVLIQGENGTGKELIARALHYNSSRRDKPLVTVHCGAIPESLIESELFGHIKGAFTGAVSHKKGKFELADAGTIFLDEIGDMDLALQVKLLRVLEDGTFSPVGSEAERQCDVRVVAATNRNIKKMLVESQFREDLYYRLNVINLVMPPLRARPEDIPLLGDHFIQKHAKKGQTLKISKAAEKLLLEFNYPGNVRQLENVIQRAVILCKDRVIEAEHLPEELKGSLSSDSEDEGSRTFQERKQRLIEQFECDELVRLLRSTGGKLREAARVAGMDAKNFSQKLRKYEIKAVDYKD